MSETFVFKDPLWFAALIVIVGVAVLRLFKTQRVLIVPFAARWGAETQSRAFESAVLGVGLIGLSLLVAALARPQLRSVQTVYGFEAYDVVLAIDVSRSMLSEDYELDGRKVNRLEALKPIIERFVTSRARDRIGIVVFSGKAYTCMPPTWNHARLLSSFDRLEIDRFPAGTAIGDGLVLALQNLTAVRPASLAGPRPRFVVLMSDGTSNAGLFSVSEGLELAQRLATRIYTIASGTGAFNAIPYWDENGEKQYELEPAEVDEGTLWNVAEATGGRFFRAADAPAIHASFAAIGERQSLSVPRRHVLRSREVFFWLAAPGLALVLLAAELLRLSPARCDRFAGAALAVLKGFSVAVCPSTRQLWLRRAARNSRADGAGRGAVGLQASLDHVGP